MCKQLSNNIFLLIFTQKKQEVYFESIIVAIIYVYKFMLYHIFILSIQTNRPEQTI